MRGTGNPSRRKDRIRELSREEAKGEILEYFKKNPGRYPSDAAVALNLDAELVRDVSLELVEAGKLEP